MPQVSMTAVRTMPPKARSYMAEMMPTMTPLLSAYTGASAGAVVGLKEMMRASTRGTIQPKVSAEPNQAGALPPRMIFQLQLAEVTSSRVRMAVLRTVPLSVITPSAGFPERERTKTWSLRVGLEERMICECDFAGRLQDARWVGQSALWSDFRGNRMESARVTEREMELIRRMNEVDV